MDPAHSFIRGLPHASEREIEMLMQSRMEGEGPTTIMFSPPTPRLSPLCTCHEARPSAVSSCLIITTPCSVSSPHPLPFQGCTHGRRNQLRTISPRTKTIHSEGPPTAEDCAS
jgi:hypothetical protein